MPKTIRLTLSLQRYSGIFGITLSAMRVQARYSMQRILIFIMIAECQSHKLRTFSTRMLLLSPPYALDDNSKGLWSIYLFGVIIGYGIRLHFWWLIWSLSLGRLLGREITARPNAKVPCNCRNTQALKRLPYHSFGFRVYTSNLEPSLSR